MRARRRWEIVRVGDEEGRVICVRLGPRAESVGDDGVADEAKQPTRDEGGGEEERGKADATLCVWVHACREARAGPGVQKPSP